MENQLEKGHLHSGSGQTFKRGLLKLYGRGRKVLIPSHKMAAKIQRKGCFPLFSQLLSPSSAIYSKLSSFLTRS